jgi:hypothetical protein
MNSPLSMEEILAGVKQEGHHSKTASAASRDMSPEDAKYAEELALLDKVANDMSQDELLKIAASAKLTGEIMSDIQLEKLADELPARIFQKIAGPLQQLVAHTVIETMKKLAVGDSETITGHTKEIEPDGNPQEAAHVKDQVGKNEEPVGARDMAHAERTEGASTQGGGDPKSNQGEHTMQNPEGDTVHKLSSPQDHLQALLQRAGVNTKVAMDGMPPGGAPPAGGAEMPGMGGGEDPQQLLQQILAKQAAGEPLSPQEQEILQQLLGGAGGAPPMGAPGGDPGGMVAEASAARVQGVTDFLRQRLLQNA